MKATTVFVFALTAASVCAQPIVIPREYYYAGVPRAVADLEARGWSVNWHKVGDFAKGAAKIGADILFKRMDEDEFYARGFITLLRTLLRSAQTSYSSAWMKMSSMPGDLLTTKISLPVTLMMMGTPATHIVCPGTAQITRKYQANMANHGQLREQLIVVMLHVVRRDLPATWMILT
ncbi:hypothetical protein M378DRAFT_164103, partial [Amanita muscaria Koide BX008]